MSRVLVFTTAYNAERTVARTIESVISQTYPDFSYCIVDNGSQDETGAIIKTFAERDGRIMAKANAANNVWEPGNSWSELLNGCDGSSYFCMLDADDEYKPDFLNRCLAFIDEHQVDIAVCGSDFLDGTTGTFLSSRSLGQDLILEGESFGTQFPYYHQFMRTHWGKLFSVPVLRKWSVEVDSFTQGVPISYGSDTLIVQVAFQRARRVGILSGSLHNYYVNTQSSSFGFTANRVRSDRILFDAAKDFLMSKVGHISPHNEHFLYSVYLNAIRDTLQVLMTAQMPDSEKIEHARYIKGEMDEIQRFFATLPADPSSN